MSINANAEMKSGEIKSTNCILCGECVDACPEKALKMGSGNKAKLKRSKTVLWPVLKFIFINICYFGKAQGQNEGITGRTAKLNLFSDNFSDITGGKSSVTSKK